MDAYIPGVNLNSTAKSTVILQRDLLYGAFDML
jgi:hypothetical protein